jgi:hypothetical protein
MAGMADFLYLSVLQNVSLYLLTCLRSIMWVLSFGWNEILEFLTALPAKTLHN